jgi:hypothetical protein
MRGAGVYVVAVALVSAAAAVTLPRPAHADAVVGTGTADSCTEAALDAALGCNPSGNCSGNGNVTFNCGGGPVTITVTSLEMISGEASIDGGGLVTLDAGGTTPLFNVTGGALSLANLTISGGAGGYGGAIANIDGTLTVTNCTFSGNSANLGGAIFNSGMLTVTNCTFFGNIANAGYNGPGGGAIFNSGTLTLTVTNSTFTDNSANVGSGGAILNDGNALIVTNCTFSGNNASYDAGLGGNGGAIASNNPVGAVNVTNCTFSGNSANGGNGGAIYFSGNPLGPIGHPVTVFNTILANSTGGNCYVGPSLLATPRPGGAITDGGHNLEDGESCGFSTANGSMSNTNPDLDPAGLADNGGPTQTIALLPDSPAINAGDEFNCAAAPVNKLDQRGFVRPGVGATKCSIGAYEFNSGPACGPGLSVFPEVCTSGQCVTPSPTPSTACVGDCDAGGSVTIDEIITLVNIALGSADPAACAAGIPSGSQVNVALIIQAVNSALYGCA